MCGGTHGSRPTLHYFVGQGPCALPWVQGKTGSGRRGNRRSAASGRGSEPVSPPAGGVKPRPYEGLQGMRFKVERRRESTPPYE